MLDAAWRAAPSILLLLLLLWLLKLRLLGFLLRDAQRAASGARTSEMRKVASSLQAASEGTCA